MRKIRMQRFYVKAFKITNPKGNFTSDDFHLFQEKFSIIRKLYLKPEVNCDCYINFRTITKEVKRAAHNAGLKCELSKVNYESLANSIIISSDDDIIANSGINLLVFIKPVPQLKGDNFTILQVRATSFEDTHSSTVAIEFPDVAAFYNRIPDYVSELEV